MLLLHGIRVKLSLHPWGVCLPSCLISAGKIHCLWCYLSWIFSFFLTLFSIRVVQDYLILSLSDFLLRFSPRLFVCGFILMPYQILFPCGLVCRVISDPVTYAGLLRHRLTICIYPVHFGNDSSISTEYHTRYSVTVSSFSCPGKAVYFLPRRPFVSPDPVSVFTAVLRVLPCISASAQPSIVFFYFVLHWHGAWPLKSIENHKFFLMGLYNAIVLH
jgi:hypothetical protein